MSDEKFDDDLDTAQAMLERDDLDGFYVGVVVDDELDVAFSHRRDDPETVGRQALALLAHHIHVLAETAGVALEQVVDDASRFAAQLSDEE